MSELLVLIITIFVIFMSIWIYKEGRSEEVDYVVSQYDKRGYLVRNLPDKDKAAELLSQIRLKLELLISSLKKKYPNDDRITRLYEKFDPNRMSEASANSAYTSYSVNKGEKIVFCLRQRDDKEHLMDINTMLFVAIHEIAHMMTKSVGHTPEFWDNMKFLLVNAIAKDVKIYEYQPYHEKPQPYCGTVISDTPLKL